MDQDIRAQLPFDIEVEQRLLGSMMADNSTIDDARELPSEKFYDPLHRRIFETIIELHAGNPGTISAVTVYAALKIDAGLEEVGGLDYLRGLERAAPALPRVKPFVQIIEKHAEKRDLIRIGEGLAATGYDAPPGESSSAQITDALEALRNISAGHARRAVRATPYQWTPAEQIPPRKFLFASRHAIAGHASLTGAPGGTGKSSLLNVEALAHCTGRNLLHDAPLFRGKSWILGLEDPFEEHQRRIQAAAAFHKISESDLEGRLFLDTSEQDFVIARDGRDGIKIAAPVIDGIIERIRDENITLLTVDPFVASHSVSENDNGAIDTVARQWVRIARETGCAVELCHHLRKGNGNEPTVDDFRGASALVPAVRSARMLSTMSKEDGDKFGVREHHRFYRVLDGKKNMAARSTDGSWRELVVIDLCNGQPSDHVAAVAAWSPPDAEDGVPLQALLAVQKRIAGGAWRESSQSPDWAGKAIAEVLEIDYSRPHLRMKCLSLLQSWIKSGALKVVVKPDRGRKERQFVEVGQWVEANV